MVDSSKDTSTLLSQGIGNICYKVVVTYYTGDIDNIPKKAGILGNFA